MIGRVSADPARLGSVAWTLAERVERARADRHQDRRELSDAASAASVCARHLRERRRDDAHPRSRRHPEPRLDRPWPARSRQACGGELAAARRSSSARWTSTSTTAGAWIIRRCRPTDISMLADPDALVARARRRRWVARARRLQRAVARSVPPTRRRLRRADAAAATPGVSARGSRARDDGNARARIIPRTSGCRSAGRASICRFAHPLDYIGFDGGGGIGSGPGMAVGAALALRDGRSPAGRGPRRRRLPDGR